MELEKLVYEKNYEGPFVTYVDWVAGGNFDGYILRKYLNFSKENNCVYKTLSVIDSTRYDGRVEEKVYKGTYEETDKATITCNFENYQMRGKILGNKNQFISFSCTNSSTGFYENECYEIRDNNI